MVINQKKKKLVYLDLKLNTLNINNRTEYHALTQMHKIINGAAPHYLIERIHFRSDIHNYNTRNLNFINLKKQKKSVKDGTFFVKTAKDYNNLLKIKIIKKLCLSLHLKKHVTNIY